MERKIANVDPSAALHLFLANAALTHFPHPERSVAESRNPVALTGCVDSFSLGRGPGQPQRFPVQQRDPPAGSGMTKFN